MERDDIAPIPGYPVELGLLLASLEDSTREWQLEVGEPTVEAITWQPISGSYSIGGIALHMAWVEVWWLEVAALGLEVRPEDYVRFMVEETDVDAGKYPTPPAEPWSWYVNLLKEVRARSFEAVKKYPSAEAVYTRRTEISYRWTLSHIVQHDSYHGGQIAMLHSMYLAQMGANRS